jgi:hypothetical protein
LILTRVVCWVVKQWQRMGTTGVWAKDSSSAWVVCFWKVAAS